MEVISRENNTLFIEEDAFYNLCLTKDDEYMLPRDKDKLPSSGFYIQVSYNKFLPHKQNTPFSSFDTCFTFPPSSENPGIMVLKRICCYETLPKHISQLMAFRIQNFIEKLTREASSYGVLVPIYISIMATVFLPQVKHLFHSYKIRILDNHAFN
ncbi:hypothetical protein RND81_10G249900 [Saponaria officinalis]|uniref:Uncharacterized protein n=1 Tax=Saponaria officinalis TaxID=3572 RepID=A0AAW1I6W7_SAPOF